MSFFKLWICFVILALSLLPFRSDGKIVILEILGMLFTNRLIGFIFSALVLFIFLPFTVPYSIKNIINKNK